MFTVQRHITCLAPCDIQLTFLRFQISPVTLPDWSAYVLLNCSLCHSLLFYLRGVPIGGWRTRVPAPLYRSLAEHREAKLYLTDSNSSFHSILGISALIRFEWTESSLPSETTSMRTKRVTLLTRKEKTDVTQQTKRIAFKNESNHNHFHISNNQ